MPLNGDALGAAIMAKIDGMTAEEKYDRDASFKAMGAAIVEYIQANAVVSVNVTTACGAGGGSGAGTGTIS
jgi:hypothetical protein